MPHTWPGACSSKENSHATKYNRSKENSHAAKYNPRLTRNSSWPSSNLA